MLGLAIMKTCEWLGMIVTTLLKDMAQRMVGAASLFLQYKTVVNEGV